MSQLFIVAFRTEVLGFIAQQAEASQLIFSLFEECFSEISCCILDAFCFGPR